jgi:signal transduction histidine kinase
VPHWAKGRIRRHAGSPQAYARGLTPSRETVITIGRMGSWMLLAMAVVVLLSVALLRSRPLAALALLIVGSAVVEVVSARQSAALLLFLLVLSAGIEVCYIAATRPRRTSITAAVVALGVLGGYAAAPTQPQPRLDANPFAMLLTVAMATVIAWLIGHSIRQGHVHGEALHAQAQAQAATAERLRIARELHDMVAHSIGIIAIQAGVGSRVIATQPAEARKALDTIEATSRQTLAGLRQMLGTLRRAEPGPDASSPPLDPAPGLADLGQLAAMTLDAGVRVDVRWRGSRRPLPAEVDLSAFRIVQEAVTNVVRHAGTGHCRVSIDRRDDELSIEVTDDGRGSVIAGAGYGIAGMRERAGLLGGQLHAGPRPGGGFCVAARLPLSAAVPAATR